MQVLPRVQFSNNPKEIELEELLQLLNSAKLNYGHASDKDGVLQKLQLAIDHSISIVIAYVAAEKLPSYSEPEQENKNGSQVDWSWVAERRRRKKRKVLAGFARVSGDCALTATIHDLVVLPELQGLGLGRRLLAKATTQVRNKYGTTDIGLAADTASYGFFRQCGFDLDREESTFMLLQSPEGCKTNSCAAVKSRPSLIALLDQFASS